MLKGIPTEISSDLLKALADMGTAICSTSPTIFPLPKTKTPNGIVFQAKGYTTAVMIGAILQLLS